MRKLLLIIFTLLATHLYAQKKVIGRVLDRDEKPIKYVQIVLKGATTATYSNNFGYFEIELNKQHTELIASHVSFESIAMTIPEQDYFMFYLDKAPVTFPQIDLRKYTQVQIASSKQEEEMDYKVVDGDTLYAAESNAKFNGGFKALFHFVGENFVLPQQAKDSLSEASIVSVTFTVNEYGAIRNIATSGETRFGIGEHIAAIISKMPEWKPATQKRFPVAQDVRLDIMFGINPLASAGAAVLPKEE